MVDIRRNVALQSAFVRWGGAQQLRFPLGIGSAVTSQEIARATWSIPAEWGLLFTARAEPAAALAGISVAVAFQILVGVGSTITTLDRVIVLSPVSVTGDLILPSVPGATIAAFAVGTPSAPPVADLVITVAMLATPLFYDARLLCEDSP